tara:strand:- start:715 stop:2148 length:1434 start_codon:yes stop_codon:yes gene_type:complete
MNKIKDLIVSYDFSIKKCLKIINKNARGVCFVLKSNKLVGIATDGDVRRAMIKGAKFNQSIEKIMNKNFKALNVHTNEKIIQSNFSDSIKIIPLIDKLGNLVDFADIYSNHRVPLYQPQLGDRELKYLQDCIKTNWISSQGKYVKKFELQFEQIYKNRHSVAVSSGTTALHLALLTIGIKKNDEVIIPNLTFAATANSVIYCGARPVLCDVDKETWVIKTENIESLITSKTKAIIPVHLYGYPCNMKKISKIAKKHKLYLIEDCAEALGSKINNKLVGSFGDIATFSFYGNKTITTGEGGMLIFKNKKLSSKSKLLRDHGMDSLKKYWHNYVGYNYRLTNLQAAVGVAQMERYKEIIKIKIKIAKMYNTNLKNVKGIFQLPKDNKNIVNTFWLYTIILNKKYNRDQVIKKMLELGIDTRPVFYPLNLMPPYKKYSNKNLKNSELISKYGISLPSSLNLDIKDIIHITKTFEKVISTL